jgi:outer membrane receptor protein involved in Fe transport
LTLRAEVYERVVGEPRVRFENLFDVISKAPELENDRVRIASERSVARGIELFLGGAAGRRLDYFVTYSRTESFDRIAGRDVPRAEDQPHAGRLDLTYHAASRLDVSLSYIVHTGWPTTAIDAELAAPVDGAPEAGIVPILGPLRNERLPTYQRLDLRLARPWKLRRGRLQAYLEVQNLLDRRNLRGYEPSFELVGDDVEVELEELTWGRLFPSAGVRWSF